MTHTVPPPSGAIRIDEEWPADLRLLLGPGAAGLLHAVAEAAGGTLVNWRPRQVNHQPGRSSVVQYRTGVRWTGGETTSETFVAATGERIPAEGAAVFAEGADRVAVWRWPQDPFLPGLSEALDPVRVAALLDGLGVDGGAVQIRTRAYRPGRRAVVEVTGRRGRLFLKVVRPDRVEQLHRRHRSLVEHLPVPDSLGWSNSGILVLTALAGETLRAGLRSARQPLPPPESVSQLLGRFPLHLAEERPSRDLVSTMAHHATVIEETVPVLKSKLEATVEALTADPNEDPGPVTAVHGDLYEAQLMVNRGHITGLLDIDTAGSGFRVDDFANFCAHLSVLALMTDRPRQVRRFGAALLAHAETQHPRPVLRRRIAAAVLGLATGPFRVLEANWEANTARRLDLAVDWVRGSGDK
jgi:hypothetical protein